MASTSRLRPPICLFCRSNSRSIHTSTSTFRALQKYPSSSSSSSSPPSYYKPASSRQSFSPSSSSNLKGKANAYLDRKRLFKFKSPTQISNISDSLLQEKLEKYLQSVWINGDTWTLKTANELGFNRERFKDLAYQFATRALFELRGNRGKNLIQWNKDELKSSFIEDGIHGLERNVFSKFVDWSTTLPLPLPNTQSLLPDPTLSKLHQLALCTDYRFPGESFPFARQERRKLILHVGPTNSGKTYNALIALARAKTGVYAGPLRLLAHEVFSRFNEGKIGNEGKRVCNLLTGEEQRILDPNASLSSCTVEMFPLGRKLEVGVIDEIQMIGDAQRGNAWTQAILGCQCDELHMCGEESVVDLIQTIAKELGEELEIKRYTRLSPLIVAKESLKSDLTKIKRGDCLVTFSRNNIFHYKKEVEEKTGLKVAVAYGGLPPEVREEQARAFNEGKYDVLVASDAVGMGLNLIVFETLRKYNGREEIALSMPQIKQIAGRAGRFGVQSLTTATGSESIAALDDAPPIFTAPANPGEVTTLDPADMELLREAINYPVIQVTQAALAAPFEAYSTIRNLLPKETPFSKVYELLRTLLKTSSHYSPSPEEATVAILDVIEDIHPLTFGERHLFGRSPVSSRDATVSSSFVGFVEKFARGEKILMKDWGNEVGLFESLERIAESKKIREANLKSTGLPESKSSQFKSSPFSPLGPLPFTQQELASLESFHRCLTLYLWLSYRLPTIFCDSVTARPLRKEIENSIEFALEGIRVERKERMEWRAKEGIVGRGPEGRFQGGTDRRDEPDYNNRRRYERN